MLRNAGTAYNSVGCFKWFAIFHRRGHDWYDSAKFQLKGLRKLIMIGMSSKLRSERALLNQNAVNAVVRVADAFDGFEFIVVHRIAWALLWRVQSEIPPLEA